MSRVKKTARGLIEYPKTEMRPGRDYPRSATPNLVVVVVMEVLVVRVSGLDDAQDFGVAEAASEVFQLILELVAEIGEFIEVRLAVFMKPGANRLALVRGIGVLEFFEELVLLEQVFIALGIKVDDERGDGGGSVFQVLEKLVIVVECNRWRGSRGRSAATLPHDHAG